MAYLGQGPFQEFTNPPTKDSFTGDGSTVAFDMASEVPSGSQNALEVFVDNVRQEPGTGKAFTLGVDGSGDTKRITFSAAPANGASIYVINDKTNSTIVAPLQNDLNGTELILDADGDTSITADTDDRIDFKIANVEHFSFSNSSGDTVIKPMVDAKDILFQQYDGRTLLDINDGGYIAIANGATGPGQLRLYEDTDNGTNFTALQVGTQSGDITYTLPTADGSSGTRLTTNGSGTLSWAATNVPTSADGQALGSASAEWSDLFLADGGVINLGADQDTTLTHVADTGILLNSTRQLQFGDSGTYIHQSADGVLDLVSDTEIEINATTIDINGAVQISGTTTIAGNLVFGSATVTEAQLEILDGATVTTTELNIMDGGTSATSTTVADADRVVFNDGGTMKQVAVTDLAAYFDDEITSMPNLTTAAALVTVSALDTGSITSGFGNIDNGASNITSGGLVKLDVDADADDVTGDSATGRLTLGAGEDLNLYHGGTNSYIVNDTGDLILKTGASDEDMIFQGNDGGAAITALTLDMSAAGAAAFNSTVTATGFIIGSANIAEAELEMIDGITAGTVIASKALVADADIDITGGRNITISGELDAGSLDISGDADIDGTANLDVVDIDGAVDMASTLQVDGAITSSAGATITTADNTDTLSLISTDADAAVGPNLRMYRNSGSPADNDYIGEIQFEGRNDNSQDVVYAGLASRIVDASDGTEDGRFELYTSLAGAQISRVLANSTETVINQDSVDLDFRVESNGNANMLFVDGGNNRVGVGTNIPSVEFEIADSNSDCEMTIGSWADNVNTKSALNFVKSRTATIGTGAATATNENIGEILAYGYDTGNTARTASQILFMGDAAPDGDAVPGKILFKTSNASALQTALTIDDGQIATFSASVTAKTDTDTSNTGNVTLDFAANQNFVLTLTGNTTLVNPTTEQVGQSGFITLIQDGTGSRTLAVGDQYFGPGGSVPTISTAANSIDIIPYIVIAAGKILLGEAQLAFADAS